MATKLICDVCGCDCDEGSAGNWVRVDAGVEVIHGAKREVVQSVKVHLDLCNDCRQRLKATKEPMAKRSLAALVEDFAKPTPIERIG